MRETREPVAGLLWGAADLVVSAATSAAESRFVARWSAEGRRLRDAGGRHPVTRPGSPVVLVPGVYESSRFLDPLADLIATTGRPVVRIPELGRNTTTLARQTEIVAERLAADDLTDVTLVAHSKGGLIGKSVMLAASSAARIRDLVAVATPFAGSRWAPRMPVRALRALSPRDAAILALAADASVDERITSIYSAFDPQIPEGSRLPGARNVRVDTWGHFRILADPRALEVVLEVVSR